MPDRSTIFALSSGRPPAAIAVVRISGPHAGVALEQLIGRVPEARKAALARVRDPANGETIDEALALWFPAPRSETGEDVAELQLHGGHAVIAAVLDALAAIEGCRPAEAGEFTRRAFVENHYEVHRPERRQDLGAFPFAYDGPSWSFQCANAGVAINADHQEVAERAAAFEGANMPRMQQIETAVGEDSAARAASFAAHSLHKFCS